NLLPENTADILIRFAMWVAIPALLFSIIAEEKVSRLFEPDFYTSFGGSLVVVAGLVFFYVRFLQKKPLNETTLAAFMAVGSNTAFVALPVLHSLYGQKAVLPTAIATLVLIVLILVTTLILEKSRADESEEAPSIAVQVGRMFQNPLVLSSLLGVAYAATGLPLPDMGKQYLSLLAAAVTPCALFAIGLSIRLDDIRMGATTMLVISGIKLIIFPGLVFGSALLLGLDPILTICATICAAVPIGKTAFVFADTYDAQPERVASTITVSSIASVFTLTAWIAVLSQVFPGAHLNRGSRPPRTGRIPQTLERRCISDRDTPCVRAVFESSQGVVSTIGS
ncbi:MAG: AEC family transporter, partial [Pseudomonadota bacterium]